MGQPTIYRRPTKHLPPKKVGDVAKRRWEKYRKANQQNTAVPPQKTN